MTPVVALMSPDLNFNHITKLVSVSRGLPGLLELTAAERALVNVEAPAVAVTVNVYELAVLSVKVKVTEVLVAADVL